MAQYLLKDTFKADKARRRLEQLIKKGSLVELREIKKRSLSQNNYLYLCLSFLALELGCSLFYVKTTLFKCTWNRDIFVIKKVSEKTGLEYTDVRSTADLDKEEMTRAIDTLITKASLECNVRLPCPTDLVYQDEMLRIQEEVFNNQKYL